MMVPVLCKYTYASTNLGKRLFIRLKPPTCLFRQNHSVSSEVSFDKSKECLHPEISKKQKLALYTDLLKVSRKISSHNISTYIRRRARSQFKENKNISVLDEIVKSYNAGVEQLEIMKFYAIIYSKLDQKKYVVNTRTND